MKQIQLLIVAVVFLFASCSKNEMATPVYENENTEITKKTGESFYETFENGSKGSYSGAYVTIDGNQWYLNDALLGSLANDRKVGSKSVRMRYSGYARMMFDLSDGASQVSFKYAKYGSDASSTIALWYSTNSGSSWTKAGELSVSSTSLQTATFNINVSGSVRFYVGKVSTSSARVNIDEFKVYANSGGSGSGDPTRDDHLALGNPSGASTSQSNNYLFDKDQMAISYNNSKGSPNWVAWHLSEAWFGSTGRRSSFYVDNELPSSFTKVYTGDYTNSGFNRGHMCPSADRSGSVTDNYETFETTNIIPQSPNNNQQTWRYLEDYCRDLADEGYEMYIFAGVDGVGGTGSNGYATSVKNKITVPAYVWKIVVVLPVGSNDLSRVSTSTRVIAVYMPNNQTVNQYDWEDYRVSVDYIENRTGYNFLSNVSSSIQAAIEARVDNE